MLLRVTAYILIKQTNEYRSNSLMQVIVLPFTGGAHSKNTLFPFYFELGIIDFCFTFVRFYLFLFHFCSVLFTISVFFKVWFYSLYYKNSTLSEQRSIWNRFVPHKYRTNIDKINSIRIVALPLNL